ncbi:outer membrane lipoprotein carrier protein LolA [Paenarthrobacter sp. NPDC091669]|uniref:LolA family protein n=1 Tax=Paenarthrobacter sp. NPDC091669 TaxID=3364384 RepID=UPI00382330BF
MARSKQRWLPAGVIALVAAMAAVFGSVQAGATVSLPAKTADEILAMIARTEVRALSGTVEQTAALGLPEIPAAGPGIAPGAASAMELLTGSHTARVYLDGPSKARLQIMDRMAERDVVINGRDAWFYNSADNSATHLTAPQPSPAEVPSFAGPRPSLPPTSSTDRPSTDRPSPDMSSRDLPTPEAMASRFLAAIDDSTEVSVGDSSSVAGRSAYRLSLHPRSTATLVESVAIDVDAETGLPLGVEVRAKGQSDPAYSLAFTEVNLSTPDAALFEFTPPPGATVTEKALPAKPVPTMAAPGTPTPEGAPEHVRPRPTITGEGWDLVVAVPAGSAPAGLTSNPQLSQALQPVDGGRALTTSLVSILILDDGRVYAGMVPLERLQSAAAAQ